MLLVVNAAPTVDAFLDRPVPDFDIWLWRSDIESILQTTNEETFSTRKAWGVVEKGLPNVSALFVGNRCSESKDSEEERDEDCGSHC